MTDLRDNLKEIKPNGAPTKVADSDQGELYQKSPRAAPPLSETVKMKARGEPTIYKASSGSNQVTIHQATIDGCQVVSQKCST